MSDQVMKLETALSAALAELNAARDRIMQLEALSDLSERLVNAGSFQMEWDTFQVRWSDNTFRIFGISREEFGQNYTSVTEFIHPDDRASFNATMARVIATRESYAHTHRIVRPNGEVRYVREAAATVGGAEGNVFLGITQDITDLVETKAAEADLQAMVRLAGEIAKVGGWKIDLETQTVEITPVTASFHDAPDLRTLPLAEAFAFYSDESSKRLQAAVSHSIETGSEFDETATLVSRIGSERTVRVMGFVERDQGTDRIVGLKGALKDITELAEAQKTSLQSAEFARMAERVARLGAWRFDVARQEMTWSAETALIHDEPPEMSPTLGDAINYYRPEHREHIRSVFGDCVENGRSFDETLQIVTAKGRNAWVRAIGEPVRNRAGQIVAVQGAFQDITDMIAERYASEQVSRRLHQTLENISDAFILLDADWRFSFLNSQAEALLQRGREDLLGKVVWEEYPEAVGGTFHTHYERVVKEGGAVRFEEFFAPLNLWVEVNAYATPEGLSVYFRDVTQHRARNAQLRLLEAAVARQNDVLLITEAEPIDGPDGPKIVYVNAAFERRTGYSFAEVIGKTPRILQGPKTQRHELHRIRQSLKEWKPVRSELINYTKSGDEVWLELDIVPLADENGKFTHWVAIERDISDRKKTEQALHISEERFRLVAKAAGNAIWDCDLNGGSLSYNNGMKEIFGHDPDQNEEGSDVWEANIHPDDASRVAVALDRLKSGSKDILLEQYRFRRADGSWAIVEDRAFAVRDGNGRAIRILGCITDISERLQLENRLHQAQKMEAVGQLTGGVAHDFNNLLTVILGSSEILEESLVEQPHLQKLAKMSLNAAERGADLTSRLLAFSRKQALQPRVIDVAQLVQNMDALLRRTIPENISIEIVRGGGLWKVEVDAAQLEAALLNLAVNARDAMPEGGYLTIEIANAMLDADYVAAESDVKPGQYAVVTVTDTGHGIPPENLDRVFEPFFTTKEVGRGTGLGLSMVFGFVKQSGGHVRVYSELGEGTSVKLYFPRSLAEEEPVVANHHGRTIIGGTETVLVVEDDSAVREHAVTQLRSLGYNVIEASSGAKAIEILRSSGAVDLLFTDVVMPGMGGRNLAEAAANMRPLLKILYTSGYTENSIVHNGRLDRGVKLLNKPYRRDQLAAQVRTALDEN